MLELYFQYSKKPCTMFFFFRRYAFIFILILWLCFKHSKWVILSGEGLHTFMTKLVFDSSHYQFLVACLSNEYSKFGNYV